MTTMLGDVRTDLLQAIRAGYSHIYVKTYDIDRTAKFITELFKENEEKLGFQLFDWSIAQNADPMSALTRFNEDTNRLVGILRNYNWCLDSRSPVGRFACDIMQHIQNTVSAYRSNQKRKVMIILSSVSIDMGLPDEIKDIFLPMRFDRPNEKEIKDILDFIMRSAESKYGDKIKKLTKKQEEKIIFSAKGMTLDEIENAFSYSFVKNKSIDPLVVNKIKAKMLESVAGIEYGQFTETFDTLKGYDQLKEFVLGTIDSSLSKGILLVGPPGCGKTHFCKCLGNETGLPVLIIEFANLFGSLVGETYERMQALIDIIKSMGKCIVFADEIEKGMSGVSGDGGTTSSEITQRAMAMWLKFMGEPRECYIIATCNNIDAFRSAPEYLRPGRWDCAPFYIGLPNEREKEDILKYYVSKYKVKGKLKSMNGWSGAEIEQVCRNASMLNTTLDKAQKYIIPVSKMMSDQIGRLAQWAEDNTIMASKVIKEVKVRDLNIE